MSSPPKHLHWDEVSTVPGGLLLDGELRRKGGGVHLALKSEEIHDFFQKSDTTGGLGVVHPVWNLPLYVPKTMPKVADVTFESMEGAFSVMDPNKNLVLLNLTFLRAKDLKKGIEVDLGPLVMESELVDMKKVLKHAATELYRSYVADLSTSFRLRASECIPV